MRISAGGISYHVEVNGAGEGLVLLHGFTGSCDDWDSVSQWIQGDLKKISVDIIGHGRTEVPKEPERYSILKAAADLKEILDALDLPKAVFLGYSMGGRLALTFASVYPERVKALILESASPGLETDEERTQRRHSDHLLAERILKRGVPEFERYWSGIPLFQSQRELPAEKRDAVKKQRLKNSEQGLANSLTGMGTGSQPSWWGTLGKLEFPVMLITGEWDDKFCRIADKMADLLVNAEWKIIEKAGHAIHVEQPEKFGKIVSGFLSNLK
ncbi:2-succinyl-6-hydroxy-2,4-cyclohexadiene-1-carboxylate synthase [Peribacillus kribbensis]|uniref:2-succinyl-6-hydroxy-2, 4-cyclohexadiene-1-carboxylate synthase n=1 Tax=Peribacillus kribbensis TaxID=356658 RepID=UPI000420B3F6|nr:2-succinyl-6-hydroxy-2,4-cyclohexadiene-1-carboxylate synthase [Peribacillus kribbensis]